MALRSALLLVALLACVSMRFADGARQLQQVLVSAPFTYVTVDKATGRTVVMTPWSNTYAAGGRRLQQDNKDNGNSGGNNNNGNQVQGKYYPGYIMLPGQSVGGSNMRDAGSTEDAFLACNLDVNCQAFNTDGVLKTNIGGAEVTNGYRGVTYVKRVILPPIPSGPISVDAPFTHVNVGPGGQTTVDAPNAKVNTNNNG